MRINDSEHIGTFFHLYALSHSFEKGQGLC